MDIKEMIEDGFKEYDKKMRELKEVDKILTDYCNGDINDAELQKQCDFFYLKKELQEEMDAHFYEIAKEVSKTHTGALQKGSKYATFIKDYERKIKRGINISE